MPVDMCPPRLHHSDLGIGQMVDSAHQKVCWWNEIGVENRDEFSLGGFHAFGQRARLKSLSMSSVKIGDGKSMGRVVGDQAARNRQSLIRRIVEDLDVELVQRIVNLANGFQQSFNDELLVKDRKLDGYTRQFGKSMRRFGSAVFLVLIIKIDQEITMSAVRSQQDQDNEIGDK